MALAAKESATDVPSLLAYQRPILKSIASIQRLSQASYSQRYSSLLIKIAAAYPMKLIRWGFKDAGVTRDADLLVSVTNLKSSIENPQSPVSFRANCEKSDLNSPLSPDPDSNQQSKINNLKSGHSFLEKCEKSDFNSSPSRAADSNHQSKIYNHQLTFLSPRQWALLEPLLPFTNFPPPSGEGSGVRGRGHPPADPHALLDAIFWKFAHHAAWKDLPPGSPPMLTCRRYYRRLFLSGCLVTLYSALHKDFLASGQSDLTAFIDRGGIINTGKELVLAHDVAETWQIRTAMLLMQPAFQSLRRLLRQKEQEFRPQIPGYRNPQSTINNPQSLQSFRKNAKKSDFNSATRPSTFDLQPYSTFKLDNLIT